MVILPLISPLIDIFFISELFSGSWSNMMGAYLTFLLIDALYTLIAFTYERKSPKSLLLLPIQVLYYRVVLSVVMLRSLIRALEGTRSYWNKCSREGSAEAFFNHGEAQQTAGAKLVPVNS